MSAFGGKADINRRQSMSACDPKRTSSNGLSPCAQALSGHSCSAQSMSASLIGRLGSSVFRLSTTAASTSLAGSCFSSESALRPFHHGIRGRGGTIFETALPSAGPSRHANSPHPSSREGHHTTAWWSSGFLLLCLIVGCSRGCSLPGPAELGAIGPDAVHDHRQSPR